MNYLQLAQRLHRETGRSTAAPTGAASATVAQQRLFDWIADAWRELQLEGRWRDWKWMRDPLVTTLTANQQRYSGAELGSANFSRWRPEGGDYYVRCSPAVADSIAWWPVHFHSLDEFKALRWDVIQNFSTPVGWTVDNDQTLLIWPIPAQNYGIRIDAIKAPTVLAADDDVPGMPEEYHLLLVWKALIDGAIQDAAPEVVQRAQMHHDVLKRQLLLDQGRMVHF